MLLSRLILLFSIFEIDRLGAVSTESLLIGDSAEIKMENLLTEFLTDLKNSSFDNWHPPRFVVLGKKKNLLQTAKVLLKIGVPYFVSSEAGAVVPPLHFGAESLVLFFIDGYSDFDMNSTFAALPSEYECKALLISLEDNKTDESIAAILSAAVKMNLKNVMVARSDGQMIGIYARRLNANCDQEVTLINAWTPRKGFKNNENIINPRIPIINAQGCSMFVSTYRLHPTMRLHEDENESLCITGGLEGRLVKTIAERLNAVLLVKEPSVVDKLWTSPDGTIGGIIGDVARGMATFGIGQIRPTLERARLVDLSAPYNHECIVWTVPLTTKWTNSVVFDEFPTAVWIAVILSVLLFCGLACLIRRSNLGHGSSFTSFDVIAMTLNYAIPRNPSGVLCKLLFLLYLNYSRVISTAYSTSLSSILTADVAEPTIVDEIGIIAAGLRTAGTQSSLEMLGHQMSANSTKYELIKRYEVTTSASETLARMIERRDVAYLRHRSTIIHLANQLVMAGKPVTFHSLPECVISYYSVMVTPKGSLLTGRVNQIIVRLREAGIYDYWLRLDRAFESDSKAMEANNDSLFRLRSIFVLYLWCLVPGVLAFGAELIAFRLKLDWFTR